MAGLMKLAAGFAISSLLLVFEAKADVIVYSNDFSDGLNHGFTQGSVLTSPSGEEFLSMFGNSALFTMLTVTNLAPHTRLTLSFTVDVVGSMDGAGPSVQGGGSGDYFNVLVAGINVYTAFSAAFANYGGGNTQTYPVAGSAPGTGAAGINTLGYSGFPDSGNGIQDSVYRITLANLADSRSGFTFAISALNNGLATDEFYGIDNVVVTTNAVETPEPATLALAGAGLLAFFVRRKRRRNR